MAVVEAAEAAEAAEEVVVQAVAHAIANIAENSLLKFMVFGLGSFNGRVEHPVYPYDA